MLKYALKNALKKSVVLPNRLAVRAGAAVIDDVPSFKSPAPIGVLRVHILRARNIMKADWGWGHSDPYCVVGLGMHKHRTATKWDNENPDWEETTDLLVYHHRQLLRLKVFDEDKMKKDDPLGCILPEWTVARLISEQSQVGGDSELRIPLETKHLQPNAPRLLGGRANPKGGHASAQSARSPSGPSVVCLRVKYFDLSPGADEDKASETHPGKSWYPAAAAVSAAETTAGARLLSVKLKQMVGSQSCLEKAKGAVVSLAVGGGGGDDESCKSARARPIPPTENYGCTVRDVEMMRKLREIGLSPEDIASALRFEVNVVKTLTDPSYLSCGWNSTLHVMVPDAVRSVALKICLEGKWFSLGEPFKPSGFVEMRLPVVNWPHGALEVETSIDVGHATPATPDGALLGFGAYDDRGTLKRDEQWHVGTAPEQYSNLKPGASGDNL
jgi:hypothetical protein